jgi:hypothetical protein
MEWSLGDTFPLRETLWHGWYVSYVKLKISINRILFKLSNGEVGLKSKISINRILFNLESADGILY